MAQPPIKNPARFVPVYGVGFSGSGGDLSPVSPTTPLPVSLADPVALPAPIVGTTSVYHLEGPWIPARGKPIVMQLSGEWQGLVSLLRSTDGGVTYSIPTAGGLPLSQFTANACEPVWEENDPDAEMWFEVIIDSGSVTYRVGH